MSVLVPLLLLLVAAGGTGVALARDPRRQVLAISANGLFLTLLFFVLQAPDVALSELAVGTAALPLLFLVVLSSLRVARQPPTEGEQQHTGQQEAGQDGGDGGAAGARAQG